MSTAAYWGAASMDWGSDMCVAHPRVHKRIEALQALGDEQHQDFTQRLRDTSYDTSSQLIDQLARKCAAEASRREEEERARRRAEAERRLEAEAAQLKAEADLATREAELLQRELDGAPRVAAVSATVSAPAAAGFAAGAGTLAIMGSATIAAAGGTAWGAGVSHAVVPDADQQLRRRVEETRAHAAEMRERAAAAEEQLRQRRKRGVAHARQMAPAALMRRAVALPQRPSVFGWASDRLGTTLDGSTGGVSIPTSVPFGGADGGRPGAEGAGGDDGSKKKQRRKQRQKQRQKQRRKQQQKLKIFDSVLADAEVVFRWVAQALAWLFPPLASTPWPRLVLLPFVGVIAYAGTWVSMVFLFLPSFFTLLVLRTRTVESSTQRMVHDYEVSLRQHPCQLFVRGITVGPP